MKETLLILLLVLAISHSRCSFKDAPEYELAEWKLLKIETRTRDGKEVTYQTWEVNGINVEVKGDTGYRIGMVIWWPVQK